jgi:hypothetical protein
MLPRGCRNVAIPATSCEQPHPIIWCYVAAHRAALAFKLSSCQGQRTSNRRDHPFWLVLDFPTRSAEGFVILPSVRHVSTMRPFLFKPLAIGTILAPLREIVKAQRTDCYQNIYQAIAHSRISAQSFFGNSSQQSGQI